MPSVQVTSLGKDVIGEISTGAFPDFRILPADRYVFLHTP